MLHCMYGALGGYVTGILLNCDKIITGYSFSCTIHMHLPQQEFEPGHYHRVVSLDKKLDFALFLFTQVYKWVPVIIMLGGNLAMDKHPIQGGIAIFLVASCYRNRS